MTVSAKWIGDKLTFNVTFKDFTGTVIVLDPVTAAPGGRMFLGTTVAPIEMSLAIGNVEIVSAADGTARYTIDGQIYRDAVKFDVTGDKTNYNRLQAWIVGNDTEHLTYAVSEVPMYDPRTADLTTVPEPNTVIAIIGPQGPQGAPGNAAFSLVFDQVIPSTTWLLVHNQGRYPSVTIVDTTDEVMEGGVRYLNDNTIQLLFEYEAAGRAFVN